ncbi:MAG: hypothetical protein QM648_04870 [Solirubrobacterales bacterium]
MSRRLAELFLIGVVIALIGDAGHVQSGITEYLWDLPAIWKSAIWFPFLVGGGVAFGGWLGGRLGLARRAHDRRDAYIAAALVLGLYCLTSLVADAAQIPANAICWAVAVAIWLWWDASPPAFCFALAVMVIGPVAEIVMVELGASRYLPGHDQLLGVAPWLLPLYFATGAVLSGLWDALAVTDGRSKGLRG